MRVGRREGLRERPARRVNGRARRTRRFLTSVRQRCLQRVDNRFKAADELSNALRASSGFAEHPASASIFSRGTCYASVTRVNKQQRVSQSPAVRSCGTDSRNADFRPRRRRCSPCRASNDLPESALGLSRRSPDIPHAAGLRRNLRAASSLLACLSPASALSTARWRPTERPMAPRSSSTSRRPYVPGLHRPFRSDQG